MPKALVANRAISQTLTTIFQYATHRNPNNFHDPDTMRPERWLPATHKLYNPAFANDNKAAFRE